MSTGAVIAAMGGRAIKLIARPVSTLAKLWHFNVVATLSVARDVLALVGSGLAIDLGRVKDAKISEIESQSRLKAAEADHRIAEASEAVARSQLARRQELIAQREDELRQAEVRLKSAHAVKAEAEAEGVAIANEEKRLLIAEKQLRLQNALRRLSAENGRLVVNSRNLADLQKQSRTLLVGAGRKAGEMPDVQSAMSVTESSAGEGIDEEMEATNPSEESGGEV